MALGVAASACLHVCGSMSMCVCVHWQSCFPFQQCTTDHLYRPSNPHTRGKLLDRLHVLCGSISYLKVLELTHLHAQVGALKLGRAFGTDEPGA